MQIAQQTTAIVAYEAQSSSGMARLQRTRIVGLIEQRGGDWSIGEVAHELGMEKSSVSARINELLYEYGQLETRANRKDRLSKIVIRPVAIPATSKRHQKDLF